MRSYAFPVALALLLVACAEIVPGDGEPLYKLTPEQVVEPLPAPVTQRAAGNTSPYEVNGKTYTVLNSGKGYSETGLASWYGRKFHGRRTANGEVFNAYRATAAHRSLPLPAYARVTNLENDKSVVVRVNDRGPFHPDRIIDLSYAAAVKLGFDQNGTAKVRVETLDIAGSRDLRPSAEVHTPSEAKAANYHYIQVGAFSDGVRAADLARTLEARLAAPVAVSEILLGDQPYYRVRVGPVDSPERLLTLRDRVHALGHPEARLMPR